MSSYFSICDDFYLYTSPEKFYLEPRLGADILVIDRSTGKTGPESSRAALTSLLNTYERQSYCGFLGSIRLIAGDYLALVTQREYIGSIAAQAVWRLADVELVPFRRSTLHLSPAELADNDGYVEMVKSVLATPYFYFSYSYDLTHTMQRLNGAGPHFLSQSLSERADGRFVWNGHLLKGYRGPECRYFCLPLVHGFVAVNNVTVNGYNFSWILVSRRSVQRAGTRLFRRGIDREGNVANFVETEQIVEFQGDRASFVQIRGSIPLFWQQLPDLRYKPPPQLQDVAMDEHLAACARHLETAGILYGRQILLDLVDHRGSEGQLQAAYEEAVQRLPPSAAQVRYEPFDFHAECRKMRWDRLSILMDRVAIDQDEMGFFLLLRDGSQALQQDGVFRTNCIDCLDRTNVVQSMLARRCLTAMLRKMSILGHEQSVDHQAALDQLFKHVWADNADVVSTQYSGTGALKTDFTRTGKRTRAGLIRDGLNSLMRYYKNNFNDGRRQDAIDLFLGGGEARSPLHVERGWRYVTFPSVLLVAVAMFAACAVLPSEYSTESLLFLLFWGSMVVATFTTIFRHGPEFVDRPRLLPVHS